MEAVIRAGALRLQTTEASCDVILSCQGHRLMAHRIILSIASPMLRDLLIEDMTDPTVLIFPDVNGNTMSLILDYIYTGSVIVYSNTIKDFITAADLLKLHIDMDFLDKYQHNKEYKLFEKKEMTGGYINSKKHHQRKLPSLLPISDFATSRMRNSNNMEHQRKLVGCVIPSPWCPRLIPVLTDPRTHPSSPINDTLKLPPPHDKPEENDPNNNFAQHRVFTGSNKECELDLSCGQICEERLPRSHNDGGDRKKSVDHRCKAKVKTKKASSKNDRTDDKLTVGDDENDKHKPFKCEDCGKCFSQLRNYKYHRSVHEGTKEFAAKCPECGKVFNDRGYLSSHMKIHRDRKEYACPHCPKRFNQRVAYNMHLRIHTGVKPHECPTCGKSFSRKMLLKQHQRVHTGERPYSCPECGKTFADRSNMSLHARLHTGVKPYSCNLCPKSFTKKHHLKTHMNFHTGLKPYSCEKCGLAFSQSSNMRTHYKKCVLKSEMSAAYVVGENADSNSSHGTDTK